MGAHEIEWYGPPMGKGSVGDIVSHLDGVRNAVGNKARSMGREAEELLAAHKGTHYARTANPRIVMSPAPPRKLDWWILLEADSFVSAKRAGNPNAPTAAAMGIEFGDHRARGDSNIPGLHILGRIVGRNVRRF